MVRGMKLYNAKHVGEVHTTKRSLGGYKCTVIDGSYRKGYCTIKIKHWTSEVQYSHVKRGVVKYPYHPVIAGVGYVGVGDYPVKREGKHTKAYTAWRLMLLRCYDPVTIATCPTYADVEVCSEWRNYQNYAAWYTGNYVEGWQVDKDLLSGQRKVYSPKTCIFIPQALNTFLANVKGNNKSGCPGVSFVQSKQKYAVHISDGSGTQLALGLFTELSAAMHVYQRKRKEFAARWQIRMHGVLPTYAIKRIM